MITRETGLNIRWRGGGRADWRIVLEEEGVDDIDDESEGSVTGRSSAEKYPT
jgi:hypothetical protein